MLRVNMQERVACDDGEGGIVYRTNAELVARKLATLALTGDLDAIKIVLDRIDGRVRSTLEGDDDSERRASADELIAAALRSGAHGVGASGTLEGA